MTANNKPNPVLSSFLACTTVLGWWSTFMPWGLSRQIQVNKGAYNLHRSGSKASQKALAQATQAKNLLHCCNCCSFSKWKGISTRDLSHPYFSYGPLV
jgi:hypothetical protein